MRYTLEQLGQLFASKLRKSGASVGKQDVIFQGRIWHCDWDGTECRVLVAVKKEEADAVK